MIRTITPFTLSRDSFIGAVAFALCASCLLGVPKSASAQLTTAVPIYTDSLQAGWQNWSWTTNNLSQTTTVYSGSDAAEVQFTAWGGFWLVHGSMQASQFSSLSFYLNGGATGGQRFSIRAETSSNSATTAVPITNYVSGGSIPANQWVHITIPLTDFGVASAPDLSSFLFQDSTGGAQSALYLDQISLTGPVVPASVAITADATKAVRTVDQRLFGVNTESWDGYTDTANVKTLMTAAGTGAIRCPGGSWADGYDWTKPQWSGETMTPQYADLSSSLGAGVYVIVNYGSGTAQMAAAWVAYSNAVVGAADVALGVDSTGRDWKDSQYWANLRAAQPLATDDGLNFLRIGHSAPFAFHNWEFGNECYGGWENDTHTKAQDPVIYANAYVAARSLMQSVDPSIVVGVVITGSEDDSGNQTETVVNPITGVSHKGWTAVLFSTLAGLGVVPDSVSFHNYGDGGSNWSDPIALHYGQLWPGYAASIRTMLTDYFGATPSANVEFANTESNTSGVSPGKQTTSLVDGLFYADYEGSIMQTEFVANLWWDLHNGADTTNNLDPSLYGWRIYGDYGVLSGTSGLPGATVQDTPYPAYFAMKLLSKFARGGDTIIPATSSYVNLTAYSARQANGNLTLLIVNKEPVATLASTIALTGFTPATTATLYQYGITQDTAQSQGQTVDIAQSTLRITASAIKASFPPYSMSVLVFTQQPPQITKTAPATFYAGAIAPATITVTGKAFTSASVVDWNGSPLPTTYVSATSLTATLAPSILAAAGSAAVTVTTQALTSNAATVGVLLPAVTRVWFPADVNGGTPGTAKITLNAPAPAGYSVALVNSAPSVATIPATFAFPVGATLGTFNVPTVPVATTLVVNLTATGGGATFSGGLNVDAPTVGKISFSPSTVKGGASTTATVELYSPAPAGYSALLTNSSPSAAAIPSTVTFAAGATTASATVPTFTVASTTSVTVTASAGGQTKSGTLTVTH